MFQLFLIIALILIAVGGAGALATAAIDSLVPLLMTAFIIFVIFHVAKTLS
jgi:hypothetical protein